MNEDLSQLGPEYIQLINGQIVRRDAEEWARERMLEELRALLLENPSAKVLPSNTALRRV